MQSIHLQIKCLHKNLDPLSYIPSDDGIMPLWDILKVYLLFNLIHNILHFVASVKYLYISNIEYTKLHQQIKLVGVSW